MDTIILAMSYLLSCFIVIHIFFQFLNDRYSRTYQNKMIYHITQTAATVMITILNLFDVYWLNLAAWIAVVFAIAYFLYFEKAGSSIKCVIESEILLLCTALCEGMGVFLADWMIGLNGAGFQESLMSKCLGVTFSKVVVIFFYYMFLSRLLNKSRTKLSKGQLIISLIIILYSLVNIFVIAGAISQNQNQPVLIISMGCLVLADLYLLYFLKVSNEKKALEGEVEILEQQAAMQYAYYLSQEKKYHTTMNILHDVNKHILSIEHLYATGESDTAAEYVKEINQILKPLTPVRYTGNPILDILLTDKATVGKEKGIPFDISVDQVDLDFLDPIDVTTIFGNLIDNAIEAAEKVNGEKFIRLKLSAFQDMVILKMENSSLPVKMKNGVPVSDKGKSHGIGLLNVKRSMEKYDGNITFKQQNHVFTVDLLLNS